MQRRPGGIAGRIQFCVPTTMSGSRDVYVSQSQIRRFNLKTGDLVKARPAKEGEISGLTLCNSGKCEDLKKPIKENLLMNLPYIRISA